MYSGETDSREALQARLIEWTGFQCLPGNSNSCRDFAPNLAASGRDSGISQRITPWNL